MLTLVGVMPAPMFALITPQFLKAQLNKQNYNYLTACSISLGFHRKRLIHKHDDDAKGRYGLFYCIL